MKRTVKKLTSWLLVALFAAVAAMSLFPVSAAEEGSPAVRESAFKTLGSAIEAKGQTCADKKGGAADDEIIKIIVKVEGDPVLAVADINSTRSAELTDALLAGQAEVEKRIEAACGEIDVLYNYTLIFNGFSFEGEAGLIDKILNVKGVVDCYRSMMWQVPEIKTEPDLKVEDSAPVINADDMWSAGYTGTGMSIAVIDTGIKLGHTNFATAPTEPRYDTDDIAAILNANNMHCEELYNGTISASALYYSEKIPFRFNYVTGTTDVSHVSASNDHGTHVSSIAAGNDSTVRGIAWNAQIIPMQVFTTAGGAWSDIMAALEDAAYLGVDCVNMSLGSDCGFTTGDADMAQAFDLMYEAGVNLAVSAGNSAVAEAGNAFGGYQLGINPDNGIVSSPSTMYHSMSVAAFDNSVEGDVAYFSSWGSTSDLKIKPEIMAPGMSIYAATDPTYSYYSYSTKSGTSMATPEIAGCIALVSQYLAETYPDMSRIERMEMANTLLLSTARPRMYASSAPFSPRQQGAGLVDVNAAAQTPCYIEVEGSDRPKLEIGDDPEKTGRFTLTFDVVNRTGNAVSYAIDASVLTESYSARTINGTSTFVMSNSPYVLNQAIIGGDSSVTVPGNGRVTVTVTIDMSAHADYMDEKFPNGMYVEGFVTLDGTVDLSIPYLGFYGDWDYPSVIDRTFYWDIIEGEPSWTSHALPNTAGASNGSSYLELGANPYIETNDFLADRISISPNNDGLYDEVDVIYTGLLRNCRTLTYSVTHGNEELLVDQHEFVNKSVDYYYEYMPAGSLADYAPFVGWDGGTLADGETATVTIDAMLDNPGFDPAENECASWSFPVTIDTAPPEFVYWRIENGTLYLYATDAHYLAYVGVYSNATYTSKLGEAAITEDTRGAISMLSFDVGNNSTVYVEMGDYACNSVRRALTGEGGSLEAIELTGISLSADSMTLYEGYTETIDLFREPVDANNFTVAWSLDDDSVASVRGNISNANVTGLAEGETTLRVVATDRDTNQSFTASATITVLGSPTLNDAINAPGNSYNFTSTGTYQWEPDLSFASRIVARSTNVGASSSSCIVQSETMHLSAGDVVMFEWLVSSENNYDFLKFFVNNSEVARICGTSNADWAVFTYEIPSDGDYTFKWTYTKDGSVNTGEDRGWIDNFDIDTDVLLGDADLDGDVDMADALLTMRHAMNMITLSDEALEAADVDLDGDADSADALLIMRYAQGLIDSLEG